MRRHLSWHCAHPHMDLTWLHTSAKPWGVMFTVARSHSVGAFALDGWMNKQCSIKAHLLVTWLASRSKPSVAAEVIL